MEGEIDCELFLKSQSAMIAGFLAIAWVYIVVALVIALVLVFLLLILGLFS